MSFYSFFGPTKRDIPETVHKPNHFLPLLLCHFAVKFKPFEIDLPITGNDFSGGCLLLDIILLLWALMVVLPNEFLRLFLSGGCDIKFGVVGKSVHIMLLIHSWGYKLTD